MELDDLKKMWDELPRQNQTNINIMELIRNKNYGPLASLKRTYRKQMMAMALLPFFLLFVNMKDIHHVLTSILFWSYVAFCIGIVLFARYNYNIVKSMQTMNTGVKENLERQIVLLEKRATLEVRALRVALLFFVVLVEVVPYFQHYRMLDKWHALPVLTRIGAYCAVLLVQYFVNKQLKQRRIGRHLEHLKDLVRQMQ